MSLPHSSPQVIAFLESLKEEYPEEFTPDTLTKRKGQELKALDEELERCDEVLESEGMIGYAERSDAFFRKPDYHPLDWSNGISRTPSPRLPDLEGD